MPDFGDLVERLRRSTVEVSEPRRTGSCGSGVIASPDGTIVTNAHVIRSQVAEVRLWDGTLLRASVATTDTRRDLAELRVHAFDLPAASFGGASPLRPGELVVAVGNPLGFVGAVSTGVVHAHGPLPGGGPRIWVQSSVRLAPGNSGGPLANMAGDVVGINTMMLAAGAGGTLGLAIPGATVRHFLQRHNGKESKLGIIVRPVSIPGEGSPGLLVLNTTAGMPADSASLLIGDLIVGVNGRRFVSFSELEEAIEAAIAGSLTIHFRRGGGRQDRTVTVALQGRRHAA